MRGKLLIAALLLAVPAEAAKQASVPNRFGAIAYHRASQSWGVSYDMARARDASVTALKQCGHRECEDSQQTRSNRHAHHEFFSGHSEPCQPGTQQNRCQPALTTIIAGGRQSREGFRRATAL